MGDYTINFVTSPAAEFSSAPNCTVTDYLDHVASISGGLTTSHVEVNTNNSAGTSNVDSTFGIICMGTH